MEYWLGPFPFHQRFFFGNWPSEQLAQVRSEVPAGRKFLHVIDWPVSSVNLSENEERLHYRPPPAD